MLIKTDTGWKFEYLDVTDGAPALRRVIDAREAINEIIGGLNVETPQTAPSSNVLFFDDFSELSIEDGQAPGTGARWADSFPKINGKFGVRTLEANGDVGVKRHEGALTHALTDNGLALRASRKGNGYVAGCISAARSFSTLYGRFTARMKVNAIGPGHHLSWWLLADDGSWPPEIDGLEVIGSNSHNPSGPVNLLFFNNHGGEGGISWHDVPNGFIGAWHNYTVEWTAETVRWLVDGVEWRSEDNIVDKPMYPIICWEVGANGNGDFPGPINDATPWPAEVEIAHVIVERI